MRSLAPIGFSSWEHFAGYKMSALVLTKIGQSEPASKCFSQAARENFSKCPHRHSLMEMSTCCDRVLPPC